jgi:hypothetical protein
LPRSPTLSRHRRDQQPEVTIPISNFNVREMGSQTPNILSILYQAYGLDAQGNGTPNISSAVSMWRIGNEVEHSGIPAANAAKVAKIIVDFETQKNIPDSQKLVMTSDVDFGVKNGRAPGIQQVLALQRQFIDAGLSAIWYTRFIVSINTVNPASDINKFVTKTFPNQGDFTQGDALPMFFTETGRNGKEACEYIRDTKDRSLNCRTLADQNTGQDQFDTDVFKAGTALVSATDGALKSYFYGFSVFQWQDAFWKCPRDYKNNYANGGACTESTFGIQTVGDLTMNAPITNNNCGLQGGTYPVNVLAPKPIFSDIPGTVQ